MLIDEVVLILRDGIVDVDVLIQKKKRRRFETTSNSTRCLYCVDVVSAAPRLLIYMAHDWSIAYPLRPLKPYPAAIDHVTSVTLHALPAQGLPEAPCVAD